MKQPLILKGRLAGWKYKKSRKERVTLAYGFGMPPKQLAKKYGWRLTKVVIKECKKHIAETTFNAMLDYSNRRIA